MTDRRIKYQRVLRLLLHDVDATLGSERGAEPRAYAIQRAAELPTFNTELRGEKLVEDVQQTVHDLFIDTSWPACPRHREHPLWYRDGAWWCEADGVVIARLGELPPREAAV